MRLVTVGYLRAYRCNPALEYVTTSQITLLDARMPGNFPLEERLTEAKQVILDNASNACYILTRELDNTRVSRDGMDETMLPILPCIDHRNECRCGLLVRETNFEAAMMSLVCLPRICTRGYEGRERTNMDTGVTRAVNARGTHRKVLNSSLTFFGEVSDAKTVLPRLTTRQPLSVLARQQPKLFCPAYANVQLMNMPDLLRSVVSHINRPEFAILLERWTETNPSKKEDDTDTRFRFPPVAEQRKTWDLRSRETDVEETLSSGVMISPFWGPYFCSFCREIVFSKSLSDLLNHLIAYHQRLKESVFSCPTCVQPVISKWDRFERHFSGHHEASVGLVSLVDETQTHCRIGWGVALTTWIMVTRVTSIVAAPDATELLSNVSATGGYCPLSEGASGLLKKLYKLQSVELPVEMRKLLKEPERKKPKISVPLEESSADEDEELRAMAEAYHKMKRKKHSARMEIVVEEVTPQRRGETPKVRYFN